MKSGCEDVARDWLDARLSRTTRVGLPWPTLLAFVRLVSNPRVFDRPETIESAWVQVESWLECEPAWIPLPTEGHRIFSPRSSSAPRIVRSWCRTRTWLLSPSSTG